MNPRLALIMVAAALCSTAAVARPSTEREPSPEPEVDPRPRKPGRRPDNGARITRHRHR